ncbi:MAG: hypothetical protein QS2022_6130 [Candidatus Phytoplasma asteris]|uniref:DUF2963 domain-containing protein n=1 Tax=Onion yellows phytoplasma OY-W TaxID=428984 RepID=A6QKQ8_ONYPH|nr:MAG: hypothetical protein QS2022_6130 [Candidatus Phytoplasma asteris]BAF73544.1 hypothetical protein [Onion yellows phytoplasma OY-W]
MSSFRIGNKHYKIIPFLITTGTLLFFVFWIGGISYKYHLETEERRKLQEVDIKAKARELNDFIYNENKKLKKENEYMKDTPYEFIRDNGEKQYYNLFTHKLVKKIDKDDTIWEYDKNNGLLLKKTDRYNNVEDYGSHGKLIKKTLSDGVWMEYNPVNQKLMKRKNIDNSIEEFDDNEEKFKEIDKNGRVKFFKTKLYQNISDFKKLNLTARQLKDIGFTFQQIKEAGYTSKELKDAGLSLQELKDAGYTAKELRVAGFTFQQLKDIGFTFQQIKEAGYTAEELKQITYYSDGTINYIDEFDPQTGKLINRNPNGKINYIDEFDPQTGNKIKHTLYISNIIDAITEYDPQTGNRIKHTEYNSNGETIYSITEYNKFDGTIKKVQTF